MSPLTATRTGPVDARRLPRFTTHGPTLNAVICTRILGDLANNNQLTYDAVHTLAGVPEVYDIRTRARLYT